MADPNDVLMRMVGSQGPLRAESQTAYNTGKRSDPLISDFRPGQFCDLLSFEFALGVDQVKTSGNALPTTPEELAKRDALIARQAMARVASEKEQVVDMQPIRFSRILDAASPQLFKALVECETLNSVAIVKRKAANTRNSGEVFLRLDFTKVLVTELEWEDKEHYVEEAGSFIYRELTVRYRQQNPNGTLDSPKVMQWTMKR